MPVIYVVKFDVIPEKRALFLSLLEGVLNAMRNEPTFHQAILHVDPTNENRLMLYETWEDHEDVVNVQLHRAYRQAYHQALPELLANEREISIWRPLRTDRAPR